MRPSRLGDVARDLSVRKSSPRSPALSQRRKERHTVAGATPVDLDRSLTRRILLGAVTALAVARPLVAGEDPGRLHSLEACSGQILNLLWLIVAFAAAVWFAVTGRET